MSLDFTNKGQCIVTMNNYLADIVKAYDLAIAKHDHGFLPITKQRYETPAPENLFTVNEDCGKLPKEMAADFHTIVAKMLYVCPRRLLGHRGTWLEEGFPSMNEGDE